MKGEKGMGWDGGGSWGGGMHNGYGEGSRSSVGGQAARVWRRSSAAGNPYTPSLKMCVGGLLLPSIFVET